MFTDLFCCPAAKRMFFYHLNKLVQEKEPMGDVLCLRQLGQCRWDFFTWSSSAARLYLLEPGHPRESQKPHISGVSLEQAPAPLVSPGSEQQVYSSQPPVELPSW